MQLLLIVIPCTLVGTAIGLGLNRAGLLPRVDNPEPAYSRPARSVARPLAVGATVILATWILVWVVLLAVGLNIISTSS